MREQNIETIRLACIKANPEIMELKEGCRLDLNCGESYGWVTIHRERGICKKHKRYREECSAEEDGCFVEDGIYGTSGDTDEGWWEHTIKVADIKPYQILGRPIRLADVLLAIRKHEGSYENGIQSPAESIAIDDLVNCHWDLEADDLTQQSDECVTYLANLLRI